MSTPRPSSRRARRASRTPPPAPHDADRRLLLRVAELAERADPEALAALVTQVDETLRLCATIQKFLIRYVDALRRRRVH